MVTMLGSFPVVEDDQALRRLMESLSKAQLDELDTVGEGMVSAVRPLLLAETSQELDLRLRHTIPQFLRLKMQLFAVLWNDGITELAALEEAILSGHSMVRGLAEERAERLGQENLAILVSALESANAHNARMFAMVEQAAPVSLWYQHFLMSITDVITAADSSMFAVLSVLMDDSLPRHDSAITLLLKKADECYARVDDAFSKERLSAPPSKVYSFGPGAARELFDYEARRRLGMSGDEFLKRWHAGEYLGKPEDQGVTQVALLIPLVE